MIKLELPNNDEREWYLQPKQKKAQKSCVWKFVTPGEDTSIGTIVYYSNGIIHTTILVLFSNPQAGSIYIMHIIPVWNRSIPTYYGWLCKDIHHKSVYKLINYHLLVTTCHVYSISIATWLSHNSGIGVEPENPNSWRKCCNQVNSLEQLHFVFSSSSSCFSML